MFGDVNVIKIVVSNTVSFVEKVFKCFIGYKDDKKVKPLCIMLPKMSANRRDFNETKYMAFLVKDDELLENYNKLWDKVSNSMKKDLIVNLYTM